MKKLLLILGMHRSGTSALSGLLCNSGVYFGNDLMPPHATNQRGFFENMKIYRVHEEMLSFLDSSWMDHKRFPFFWKRKLLDSNLYKDLKNIVKGLLFESNEQILGIKDPRTVRFIPLWEKLVENVGDIELYYLVIVRDPREVIMSITNRDKDISREQACEIWISYNKDILRYTKNFKQKKLFIYSKLIESQNSVVEQVNDLCSTKLKARSEFVSKNLRHNNYLDEDFSDVSSINKAIKLYKKILTTF